MKDMIRRVLFTIENGLGRGAGTVLRPFGMIGVRIYTYVCRICWILPDRAYILVNPFIESFGLAICENLKTPTFVERKFYHDVRMRLDLREKTQRLVFSQKRYENSVSSFILKYLRLQNGDFAIDVGANVGYITLMTARVVGPKGTVLAFEPEKDNYEALMGNAKLNAMKYVRAYRCALGSHAEKARTLHINPLNRGGNSMNPFVSYRSGGRIESVENMKALFGRETLEQTVEVRTLDDIWAQEGKPTVQFLKIDVEGFEYEVIEGARELLKSGSAPKILCELTNKQTREKIMGVFTSYGYRSYALAFNGEPHADSQAIAKGRDLLFTL